MVVLCFDHPAYKWRLLGHTENASNKIPIALQNGIYVLGFVMGFDHSIGKI